MSPAPIYRNCAICKMSRYEETAEETEKLVCFLHRKLVADAKKEAEKCLNFYTGSDE